MLVAIISAAIRARQPKPIDMRIPVTTLGSAPGISTSQMTSRRDPPIVSTACSKMRGTARTPTSVLKKTRKKIVLNMMKVTLVQPRPNHVMASGSQAIPDSALKNPTIGSTTGASRRLSATRTPRPTASGTPATMPRKTRPRLAAMSIHSEPSLASSVATRMTSPGGGRKIG